MKNGEYWLCNLFDLIDAIRDTLFRFGGPDSIQVDFKQISYFWGESVSIHISRQTSLFFWLIDCKDFTVSLDRALNSSFKTYLYRLNHLFHTSDNACVTCAPTYIS